jgi:ferritin
MRKPLIDKNLVGKFAELVHGELNHFYMYKLLANQMQAVGYFGAQKYFLKESAEEVEHYQKHIDFLNDLGVLAPLPELKPLKEKCTSLMDSLEVAYDNELELLEQYREFSKEVSAEHPEVQQHLWFFLKTQTDAVGFYGDILARLETVKDNTSGILAIDKELGDA